MSAIVTAVVSAVHGADELAKQRPHVAAQQQAESATYIGSIVSAERTSVEHSQQPTDVTSV